MMPALLWSLAGLAFGLALILLPVRLDWNFQSSVGGAIAIAGMLAGLWQFWGVQRGRLTLPGTLLSVALAVFVAVPGFGAVLPNLHPLWLSRSAATLVEAERRGGEPVASVGYAEPSLVFLLGTDTVLLAPDAADAALADDRIGLVLVARPDDGVFRAGLAAHHLAALARGVAGGFDYSNGHWVDLTLYRLSRAS